MKLSIVLVIILCYTTGCATMFHGSTDQISVRSKEPGSTIYIDEMEVGTDSAVYAVPKKGKHVIRVAKEGCSDVQMPIKYEFDGVSLLGFLIDFGIVSMLLVDGAGTGAISKASQTNYVLTPNCKSQNIGTKPNNNSRNPASQNN